MFKLNKEELNLKIEQLSNKRIEILDKIHKFEDMIYVMFRDNIDGKNEKKRELGLLYIELEKVKKELYIYTDHLAVIEDREDYLRRLRL